MFFEIWKKRKRRILEQRWDVNKVSVGDDDTEVVLYLCDKLDTSDWPRRQ